MSLARKPIDKTPSKEALLSAGDIKSLRSGGLEPEFSEFKGGPYVGRAPKTQLRGGGGGVVKGTVKPIDGVLSASLRCTSAPLPPVRRHRRRDAIQCGSKADPLPTDALRPL
ncbi:hypothetical protein CBL_05354 [Carabus blaptoides fortunei]